MSQVLLLAILVSILPFRPSKVENSMPDETNSALPDEKSSTSLQIVCHLVRKIVHSLKKVACCNHDQKGNVLIFATIKPT